MIRCRRVSIELLALVFFVAATRGTAQEITQPMAVDQVQQGSLLLATGQPGRYLPAPAVKTDVRIRVSGVIARAQVTQRFHNPTGDWVEGVYVFPLPETAAVDSLRMVIGDRTIEGQIQEKEAAKQTYETAKQEGKKASLVEQQRPNIFTTWCANIGPQENVEVVISYQETVRYDQGVFSLRFPMVVGPRYTPCAASGDQVVQASPAPATHVSTGPVLPPTAGLTNPVTLRVELDAGVPLESLSSTSHEIHISTAAGTRQIVTLKERSVPADRDFVLRWAPRSGRQHQGAMFKEVRDGMSYVLVMLIPPHPQDGSLIRLSRELILVIDTSGSMHGASIDQAKRALAMALDSLQPIDSFNIIQFNSTMSRLFRGSVPATSEAIAAAREYVSGLEADGGTEMSPALDAALTDAGTTRDVRQVVFVTDGCVGNEENLFRLISARLGTTRLFTVGIGSAPNSYFMRKAAAFGRGTFTYVGDLSEVEARMGDLFRQLESPVLSDVRVEWGTGGVEAWPAKVPDLYLGEPLVVTACLSTTDVDVTASGTSHGTPWEGTFHLTAAPAGEGIASFWARQKIDALLDSVLEGADETGVRTQVLDLALRHHLISKYTSMVAIDVTPTGPAGSKGPPRPIPQNLPKGWNYEHVFGEIPQTATPASLCLLLGLALIGSAIGSLWLLRCRATAAAARPACSTGGEGSCAAKF